MTASLEQFALAIAGGSIRVVDLTQTLAPEFPALVLPPELGQCAPFRMEEVSRYDERGPAWYWNNFTAGEHVGTHFDAPVHWVSGKDGLNVAEVPAAQLVGPAVVVDKSAECAANPDFLLEIEHLEQWQQAHGPLPSGGWVLYRTGWDARADDQAAFLNANETGPHTPGISVACARWLAAQPILGVGVETVGTDAGTAVDYAQQATTIADAGQKADTPTTVEWKPLGVFALVQGDEKTSNNIFQIAVNKDGIIRGNYYDGLMDTTSPIYGSVDPKTQRAAWTIGKKNDRVFETGIYNLTKAETPILVHFGTTRTQQWLLVRVEEPKSGATE